MCCPLWKTRIAAPAALTNRAPMIGPKKNEVNIWSDQLTADFEPSILRWSDQIRV